MKTPKPSSSEPFTISGDWSKQSRMLKEKFAQLTDEDLAFQPGKEEELLARLVERLNKGPQEVTNIINKGNSAR